MSEATPDLDFAQDLDQLSREGLTWLARRIEQSTTIEQLIYRELEIDQIWRLLDQGEVVPGLGSAQQQQLKQQIEQIHDLIGVHHDARAAAEQLRKVLADRPTQRG